MHCVILDDYQSVALDFGDWHDLDGVAATSVNHHPAREDEVVELVGEAEIVVIMRERTPFPATLLERLPQLKLLVTTGIRNASVDLDAASRLGVTVCGTSSSPTPPAELTWALIHGMTRHVVTEAAAVRDGHWQTTVGTDLAGATLGVVGLGKIGSRVAGVGQAFGMDVVAWSPHLDDERAAELGVRRVAKQELFETSDVVTLHLVLSDRTHRIVGADELAVMKPTSYLVNTSRAGLVDTEALRETLDEQRIAGAGLDVFDLEPLPANDPLRSSPNVLATPHVGYVTRDNYRRFYEGAVEDIAAWLAGEPIRVLN